MNSITDVISSATQRRPLVLFKKSQSATDENVKLYTLSHLKHVDSTKFQNIDDSAIPTSGGIENAWSIEFFTISNSDRSKCEIALFAFVEQIYLLKYPGKSRSPQMALTCAIYTVIIPINYILCLPGLKICLS